LGVLMMAQFVRRLADAEQAARSDLAAPARQPLQRQPIADGLHVRAAAGLDPAARA